MTDFQSKALQALRMLVRPIVRFCVRHSLTVQDLIEAMKGAFIDVASEEIKQTGKKVNVSRLSVMTGLHRRDVMRLLEAEEQPESSAGLVTRVIGQWENDARFLGANGRPRVLSDEGERSEFRKLVGLVSTDVNAGTVLFELKRLGLVEKTKHGLKLKRAHHILKGDLAAGFSLLAKDSEELLGAVEENLLAAASVPNLHGRTEFDNIDPSNVPKIRRWLLREGSHFHRRVRRFLSHFDRDLSPKGKLTGGNQVRVIFGSYSRVSTQHVETDAPSKLGSGKKKGS